MIDVLRGLIVRSPAKVMFEPKRASLERLNNYVGARVTDTEETWLRAEMKRLKLTMSDIIRLGLDRLYAKRQHPKKKS